MTTGGTPSAASAPAIGRAMALVRHNAAMDDAGAPAPIRRVASRAIAAASDAASSAPQSRTAGPPPDERSCLGWRSALLPIRDDAAATMIRELRRLRPSDDARAQAQAHRTHTR